jgi:two-component system NtrC family sensor kinase
VVADETGQGKVRILVIDDEENILLVLRKALEREKYDVDTLLDATKGINILADSDYDLILCDMEMPKMSGIDFFREIEVHLPGMVDRILFMTGEILSPKIKDILKEYPVSIMAKPFDLSTLYQGVNEVLERSSGDNRLHTPD